MIKVNQNKTFTEGHQMNFRDNQNNGNKNMSKAPRLSKHQNQNIQYRLNEPYEL